MKLNILQIYKIDDSGVLGLFEKIDKNEFFKEFRNYPTLRKASKLYFDVNSRFLATYGSQTVNIISMESGKDEIQLTYHIDDKKFSEIVGIQFVSEDTQNYRCDLACKMLSSKNIMIF